MKSFKYIFFVAFILICFAGCSKNKFKNIELTQDSLKINPDDVASASDMAESLTKWTNESGIVCVLFGYGYNDETFVKSALEKIEKKYGLDGNGGLVYPVVFPGDLNNRISNLKGLLDEKQIRGVILLGAPEYAHVVLGRIREEYDDRPFFNIFSFFPQDDVLPQEGTCNLVLDYEAENADILEQEVQCVSEDVYDILLNSIEYIASLPGPLPLDNELSAHIKQILGNRQFGNFVDSESGISARNHFTIKRTE